MNPVFVILVLLGGASLWLIGSFLYRPIGKFFGRLVEDAKEAMFEEENKNNEKEKGENENE